jgi:hypothetical protein
VATPPANGLLPSVPAGSEPGGIDPGCLELGLIMSPPISLVGVSAAHGEGSAAAEVLDHPGRVLAAPGVDVGDHHGGTVTRERQCSGAADAAGPPVTNATLPGQTAVLVGR